ncbi:MAG: large conductance mechanosensitive channel protein MscL [Phycisphaerales bacterium]
MGFVKEFREFAIKGNVFDMAIGVIMGGAFGKIVSSLIENLINPLIGRIAGNVDFSNSFFNISGKDLAGEQLTSLPEAKKVGPMLAYGSFLSDVINFLIMAFVVFLMVKAFNAARKRFEAEKPPAPPAGPSEKDYLKEIRDLLAAKR